MVLATQSRIEGITQSITEKVKGDGCERKCSCWDEGFMWEGSQRLIGFRDHDAPARYGRVDAKTDKTEKGFKENISRYCLSFSHDTRS